jgi:hypothetical protein
VQIANIKLKIKKSMKPLAKVIHSVIPAKAGIQNCLEILDSGSRFACPDDFQLFSRVWQEPQ